jgi:hypothetical protein
MIEIGPEAGFELLAARDYYEQQRPGLGAVFAAAAERTLDAIEEAPHAHPQHPFAATPGVRRILFLPPPTFPYAFAYFVPPKGHAYVLATEQLQRAPLYWAARLRSARR